MSIEELAGACIMTGIRGATLDDPTCRADVQLLKKHRIKNVILFDVHLPTGGLRNIVNEEQVKQLTDDLRNELGDDIIIGIDQEGGEINRLTNFKDPAVSSMLSAQMQGAMSEKQLRATIEPVAKSLSESGINLVFAPCVDLQINPENPIIAQRGRSLGRDPERVIQAASTIIRTYDEHGIRCCEKHFPGHGSTSIDTHLGLADITSTKHIDEMHVYNELVASMNNRSIPDCAIMSGHLMDRSLDQSLPASLSHHHTTEVLRNQTGFDGLVLTDSIDMGAIRKHYDIESSALLAIQAGADIVLDGFNAPSDTEHPAPLIHSAIINAVMNSNIDENRLVESVDRRLFFVAK